MRYVSRTRHLSRGVTGCALAQGWRVMKAVTLFDDVPVAIKVQTPDATDEEVAILRHMTDAVCHTVAVFNTFDVNETESAFVMPLVRRSWCDGSSTRAIRKRARQLIEVLQSTHRCWQRSPPHLDAV